MKKQYIKPWIGNIAFEAPYMLIPPSAKTEELPESPEPGSPITAPKVV